MDVNVYSYPPGDPQLIDKICHEFLSQGRFDRLRKECMANADTKPAYQNLQQRVENTVSQFLKKQTWKPDLNKNQLRDSVRKHILESGFLDAGINRIVDQVVNPHVLSTVFLPEVEEVVYSYLSIPRPADKQQKRTISSFSDLDDNPPGVVDTNELKTENEIGSRNFNSDLSRDEFRDAMKIEKENDKDDLKNLSNISDGGFKDEKSKMNDSTESLFEKISNESLVSEEKSDIGLNESKEKIQADGGRTPDGKPSFKVEPPSDDSQESFSRMGVEKLQILENELTNGQDSDAMAPLEIDERTMSDSQDSDDSILKQMSPISQGRLTPDRELDLEPEPEREPEPEPEAGPTPPPPPTHSRLPILEEKNPLTFVGRIPKLKKEDDSSNTSKKEDSKSEKLDAKCVYSSDESESSKQSTNKSDTDKKSEEKKEEKSSKDKYKEDRKSSSDKSKRRDDKSSSSSSRDKRERSRDRKSRDDKSRLRKDSKDKDRKSDKSSSSNDKKSSSSSHRSSSSHKSRHRDDSRSRDKDKDKSRHDKRDKDRRSDDKRKREDDKKKKSKSVDDHSKERKKREDRRSTDRDSNERERDKSSSTSKSQGESSKKREREGKIDGGSKEKEGKSESDRKEGKEVEVEVKKLEEMKREHERVNVEVHREVKVEIEDPVVMEVEEKSMLETQGSKQELEEVKVEDQEMAKEKIEKEMDSEVKLRMEEEKEAEEKVEEEKEAEGKMEEIVKIEEPVVEESKISQNVEILPIEKEDDQIVSFKDLLSQGAIKTFKFKEPTSDFYQKFNSTGFRYFENWEIAHFDECESEFKEFINEAESNLSALSDDESDNENSFDFDELNRTTIKNSINGLGNFESTLMFDPKSGEFYKWANKDSFEKFQKQNGIAAVIEKSSPVKLDRSEIEEDDEAQSIEEKNKENQDQDSRNINQQRKIRSDKRKKPLTETIPHPEKPEEENLVDNTHSSVIKILTEYEPDDKGKVPFETINDIVYKPKQEKDLPAELINKNLQNEDVVSSIEFVNRNDEPDLKFQSALEDKEQTEFVNLPTEESATHDDVEKRMEEIMGESLSKEENDTSDISIPETPSSLTEDDKTDSVNKEVPKMDMDAKIRLFQFQSRRRSKNSSDSQKGCILARISSTKSEEDHEEDLSVNKEENSEIAETDNLVKEEENKKTDEEVFSQPKKGCLGKRKMSQDNVESKGNKMAKEAEESKSNTRRKSVETVKQERKPSIRVGLPRPKPKARPSIEGNVNDSAVNRFNLPLSPESDDAILNDKIVGPAVIAPSPGINKRKRAPFTAQNEGAIPIKKAVGAGKKRTMQQKYNSQDLYKPRPILTGSRTRSRGSGVTDSPSAGANGDQKQL